MYHINDAEDYVEISTSDIVAPPVLEDSTDQELIAQEIEEAFNDVEEPVQGGGATDEGVLENIPEEGEGEEDDDCVVLDLDYSLPSVLSSSDSVSEGGSTDTDSDCDDTDSESDSDTDDDDDDDDDSDTESSSCDKNDTSLDLSWEVVDFDIFENEKENTTSLIHRLSLVSEDNNIIDNLDKKSRVIRKFIGNSNLIEKLENLKFRKVDNNSLNNAMCQSLYLGESFDCSMVIYNKENSPEDHGDRNCQDLVESCGDAVEATSTWKGDFLGGLVEVNIQEINGLNVVNLQVEHKDILSTLLSFQRFVACTGVVSYCDVDVSSILARSS